MFASTALAFAGCVPGLESGTEAEEETIVPTGDFVRSDRLRNTSPAVDTDQLAQLVAGNSVFAFDLYQYLRSSDGNLFFSPYSISSALAMTYAGARGSTEQAMAGALDFTLGQESLHPAFNALDLALKSRDQDSFQLEIANATWGQNGYPFLVSFLDVLAENYDAGMRLLDFVNDPEPSRQIINDWVSEQTQGRIQELVASGMITPLTRLVLTNAIFFKADWKYVFPEESTRSAAFNLRDGSSVNVPMMSHAFATGYASGDGYEAVEVPYMGDQLSMLVVVPAAGRFDEIEAGLDSAKVDQIVDGLALENVALTLPKWSFSSDFSLKTALTELGMGEAFAGADFSGMTGTRELFISEVVHQAKVSVDERGTEASAGTAVIIQAGLPVTVTVDRPFVFMIRDLETRAILFVGRVLNPAL
ncbi:MAG: serpin family protein [Deltaproteobacteria bacterium]|nr:serpin family protein [Deltaproteobacteria bacterium]